MTAIVIAACAVALLAALATLALRSSIRQGRGILARPEAESWQARIDNLSAQEGRTVDPLERAARDIAARYPTGTITHDEARHMARATLTPRRSCPECGRLEGHRPSCTRTTTQEPMTMTGYLGYNQPSLRYDPRTGQVVR